MSSLLEVHADLQQELWENFQHQQPSDLLREKEAEPGAPLGANNVLLSPSGARVLVWTRSANQKSASSPLIPLDLLTFDLFPSSEADRAILTACQQMGANRKTFRHVAAQLGDKTTQQVRGRGLVLGQQAFRLVVGLQVQWCNKLFQQLLFGSHRCHVTNQLLSSVALFFR